MSAAPEMGGAAGPQPARADLIAALSRAPELDLVVIGGGATGLGVAVDAAARGFSVALVEAADFAKGTSSRATKLVHGGVRYLAQGNFGLVREALHERGVLMRNAPHLVQPLQFLLPVYGSRGRWIDRFVYGSGLALYDLLAGQAGYGRTEFLEPAAALERVRGLQGRGLAGALCYWDAQFDDARLALALARTAIALGAIVVNHCSAVGLIHEHGRVAGAVVEDLETGERRAVRTGCVVNATGVWVDSVRRMDGQKGDLVAPSQGVHLVVDRDFLPGERAILVPKTRDGRVLFAVPWLGKTILGTTDTPRADLAEEPEPLRQEIDFILGEASRYLARSPGRGDIRSVWVGLRPLVRPPREAGEDTKTFSREHTVRVERSGLVSVTGGKWTTYRAMAGDVIACCIEHGLLPARVGGDATAGLRLVGAPAHGDQTLSAPPGLHLYGTEAAIVRSLPGAERELAPGLTEAMVRFAARSEYARTVEDVLARRSRLLFLDARLAGAVAGRVAAVLGEELGPRFDAHASLARFRSLAERYCRVPAT